MRQFKAAHNTLRTLCGRYSLHANDGGCEYGGSDRISRALRGFKPAAIILAIAVLISGCGKPQQVKMPLNEHTGNYSAVASINYRELKAVAKISQETPSFCSVVFESPPSLKDMSFIFRKENIELAYKGLSFKFKPDSLPASAAAKLAVSAINRAMKDDGLTVGLKDNSLEVSGIMESGEFSLLLDKETGSIMKLSVPAEELEIEFSNFIFFD